jgi:hypothetical protein
MVNERLPQDYLGNKSTWRDGAGSQEGEGRKTIRKPGSQERKERVE